MALLCIDGGECDGCMGCYESDAQTVCCAVCGRELEPYDDVVKLETGEHICSDADCLYAQALQCSTEEELRDQGIRPNTIRLSVGTEHIDDILADLQQGFDAVIRMNE